MSRLAYVLHDEESKKRLLGRFYRGTFIYGLILLIVFKHFWTFGIIAFIWAVGLTYYLIKNRK